MDPVQAAVTAFLNAVQAAQPQAGSQAAPQAALASMVGQDVSLLFQGGGGAGLLFTLPSGQTLTAQGDFPFPPGTQVTVRVSDAGGGAIRLQTLQAQPPAPASILAPLVQGEGLLLQARLTQAGPEDGLSDLAALFRSLAQGAGAGQEPTSAQAQGTLLPGMPGSSASGASQAAPAGLQQAAAPVTSPQPGSPAQVSGAAAASAQPPSGSPGSAQLPSGSAALAPTPPGASGSPALPAGVTPPAQPPSGSPFPAQQPSGAPTSNLLPAGTPASVQLPPGASASGQPAPGGPTASQLPAGSALPPSQPATTPFPTGGPAAAQGQAAPPTTGTASAPGNGGTAAQPGQGTTVPAPSAPPVPAAANPASAAPPPIGDSAAAPGGEGPSPAPGAAPPANAEAALATLAGALASDRTPSQAALQGILRTLPASDVQALAGLLRPERAGSDPAVIQDAAQRIQAALARRPDVPAGQGDALAQLIRNLVRGADASLDRASTSALAQGPPHPGQGPAAPETWETWMRSSIRTLADPAASPREAGFHLAQAQEGTALFEIPLPWAPQAPLQMWVESDRQGKGKGAQGEGSQTVLLGLSLSSLGETRLGIAKGPEGLRVRVWAENPEGLVRVRQEMEAELKALGTPVDLRILPLQPGPGGTIPSIRSLAAGSTFQVLG